MIEEVNEKLLLEKINNAKDKPIVLEFYANWCGDCKVFAPIFEQVAKDEAKNAMFLRVNVDEHQQLAKDYNVGQIPTTVIIVNKKEISRRELFISPIELVAMFKK